MKKKKASKKIAPRDMKKTRGGAPVARYHLENAWPQKSGVEVAKFSP